MSDFACLVVLGSLLWSVGMIVLMFLVEHRLTRIQRLLEQQNRKGLIP